MREERPQERPRSCCLGQGCGGKRQSWPPAPWPWEAAGGWPVPGQALAPTSSRVPLSSAGACLWEHVPRSGLPPWQCDGEQQDRAWHMPSPSAGTCTPSTGVFNLSLPRTGGDFSPGQGNPAGSMFLGCPGALRAEGRTARLLLLAGGGLSPGGLSPSLPPLGTSVLAKAGVREGTLGRVLGGSGGWAGRGVLSLAAGHGGAQAAQGRWAASSKQCLPDGAAVAKVGPAARWHPRLPWGAPVCPDLAAPSPGSGASPRPCAGAVPDSPGTPAGLCAAAPLHHAVAPQPSG